MLGLMVWAISLALRKAILMNRETDPRTTFLRSWWNPVSEEARALRNMAAAFLLVIFSIVGYIFAVADFFPAGYRVLLTALLPMVSAISFAQLYMVSIPERISYRAKLLGMSVLLMLFFLSLGAVWIFRSEEKLYVESRRHGTELLALRMKAGSEPRPGKDMRYVARREANGFRVLAAAKDTRLPAVLPLREGIARGRRAYTPEGARLYRALPDGRLFVIFRQAREEGMLEVGFDYTAFRAHMHVAVTRTLIAVACAVLMLLIVFPFMLRAGLTAPLERLLTAVRKISGGDYSIHLPVRGRDTIGELSTAFNHMSGVIRENTAELENQVRERTAGLEVSNRKLAEMDRLKTNFFTNLSHEIRTPLTLLLAPLESVMGERDGRLERESVAGMHRNALRLLNLVNNLLNLSRLDARGDELRLLSGDIAAYVRELAGGFEAVAAARGLYLRVDAEPERIIARFDAARVETILLNLLSNAVKFTKRGGVHARVRRRGDKVEIAVEDTGPGIPESARELIFDRYGRFEGDSRYYGGNPSGSGIGLALAGELARSHGGRIRLDSEPGRGSTFILELPGIAPDEEKPNSEASNLDTPGGSSESRELVLTQLEVEAAAMVESREPASTSGDGPLVLVVEDHGDMRSYLSSLLREEYRVVTASNGREGLALAARETPALIVSDVMMPDMNGLELLAALREDERSRLVPFVLLSAKAAVADRLAGLDLEADDYITKPFHPEEFLLRVRNLMNRTGLLDGLIEKNRLEIYDDLHDHLGARLTDLAILTDKLLARTRAGNASPAEHAVLLNSLEENIALIRSGFKSWLLEVEDLRLLRDDFLDGLQLSLIRRYSGSERLIRFHATDEVRDLLALPELDSVKSILFAAAREITTNDLKYGEGAAEWTLTSEGDLVSLQVESRSHYGADATAGMGMAGIRRRVEEPGGRLRETLENGSYRLLIELPLNRHEHENTLV